MFWAQWVIEYSEGEAYLHCTLELKSGHLSKWNWFYVSKVSNILWLVSLILENIMLSLQTVKSLELCLLRVEMSEPKVYKVSPQFFCVELCVFCAFLLEWVTLASAATILFIYFHKNEHFLHFFAAGGWTTCFIAVQLLSMSYVLMFNKEE